MFEHGKYIFQTLASLLHVLQVGEQHSPLGCRRRVVKEIDLPDTWEFNFKCM